VCEPYVGFGALTVSTAGTVYAVTNSQVVKIDAVSHVMSLVAGTGNIGYSGDGGSAKAATLNLPQGLWWDASGLYIADTGNNRVRKVIGSTGVIVTVAGNGHTGTSLATAHATNAVLPAPVSVHVNGTGHLQIGNDRGGANVNLSTGAFAPTVTHLPVFAVDGSNNTFDALLSSPPVMEFLPGSTTMHLYAGGGGSGGNFGDGIPAATASLDSPIGGLATDAANNLYITAFSSGRVRVVDAATKTINSVPGLAGWNLDSNSAIAVSPAGDLFVTALHGSEILRRDHTTGDVTLVAGGGYDDRAHCPSVAANWLLPGPVEALTHDSAGDVFVATAPVDYPTPVVPTTPQLFEVTPAGAVAPIEDNLHIAVSSGDGGPVSAASFDSIIAVAVSPIGDLYVVDGGARVRRVDHATGTITTVAGNGTAGETGDGGAATAAEIEYVSGVALDSAGNLYIAETSAGGTSGSGSIRRVDHATDTITTVAGGGAAAPTIAGIPATTASIHPLSLASDAAGRLYFETNSRVDRYDPPAAPDATATISVIAGNGSYASTHGEGDGGPATAAPLALDGGVGHATTNAAGDVFLTDAGQLRVVDHATDTIHTIYVFDPARVGDGYPGGGFGGLGPLTVSGDDVDFAFHLQAGTGRFLDDEIRTLLHATTAPENLTPR
jgi:sugar lactone lactonase YvrE